MNPTVKRVYLMMMPIRDERFRARYPAGVKFINKYKYEPRS